MKLYNFKKTIILALSVSVAFVMSCQKALDINEDPNLSSSATPQLVLPVGQVGAALAVGDWDYIACNWAQYWTGGPGVGTANIERYNMTSIDVERSWSRAYSASLADLDYLKKAGQPVYAGIAKIMQAYMFQMLADLFGDVPYTEALKGAIADGSILTPKFDDPQTVIYPGLLAMLNEAITDVQTTGALIQTPGSDDLVYGGDIDSWIALANTLKLKLLVRQGNYTAAKNLMDSGVDFVGTSNPAAVWFNGASKNANPIWTRFAGSSLGMFYVAAEGSIAKLLALNDPRIDRFYTKPTVPAGAPHRGIRSAQVNLDAEYALVGGETSEQARRKYSNVNPVVFSATAPVFFMSAWESKFLQAEVLTRLGDADAENLFNEAVEASFAFVGASGSGAYLSSIDFANLSLEEKLNAIGVQKWIACNSTQMTEGWIETLRFDRPGNNIFTGVSGIYTDPTQNVLGARKYPTSLVYPTQEASFNPNTPAGRTVTDKRFWDN